MSSHVALGRPGMIVLLALALTGCTLEQSPDATPTLAPSPSGDDAARFLIQCFYPDGSEVATFTRLEEAWASTDYVRIDHCEALVGSADEFQLSRAEEDVAKMAQGGLPDEDLTGLFLRTLAACVRIVPEGTHGMGSNPTSILEAALVLCPEAPHAGLIEDELRTRG